MKNTFLLKSVSLIINFLVVNSVLLISQDTISGSTKADSVYVQKLSNSHIIYDQSRLSTLPFINFAKFGMILPSSYSSKGNTMYYYGIETKGDNLFIDGMQIREGNEFPVKSIQTYELFTRDFPINTGFVLGGVTQIQTHTNISKFQMMFDLNTDIAFNKRGINGEALVKIPLFSTKNNNSNIGPSLLVAGKYSWTNNTDPVWEKTLKLKDNRLSYLINNPLRPTNSGSGVFPNSEFVTREDFEEQREPANSEKNGVYPYIKLHIPVLKNMDLNIGNYSVIDESNTYNHHNSIFNASNNAIKSRRNFDNFINLKHSINLKDNLSINYNLNLQYSIYNSIIQDKNHKDRFFDYGYVGKFTSYKTKTYELGSIIIDGQQYDNIWIMNSMDYDTLIAYSPSNINPNTSQYTSDYFDIYSGQPIGHYQNIDDIMIGGGLVNGASPHSVYGLFSNTGSVNAGYLENNTERIRASLLVDMNYGAHNISIGGEYNNETSSYYTLNPNGLWSIIRDGKGLTNFHLRELDYDNPIIVSQNGHVDTVMFKRRYDGNSQREFDKNLRSALGLPMDGLDYIVTDSYDRENNTIDYYDENGVRHTISTPQNLFSLSMFSNEELLNGGNSLVNYAGYDYLGNRLKGITDPYSFFDDFSMAASNPKYWSGFVQDEFTYGNLNVRLGLRLDVYDANRPVLKDKYSLYPINSVNELESIGDISFNRPSTIGGDFKVYVDKVVDPTRVVGFRNGDTWYNADGIEIYDPTILDVGSGISPYLSEENMGFDNPGWSPESTFEDYSPIKNLLPQINIDYTLLKRINLYFNYSSSTTNPFYYSDFRPDQYYFFGYYANSGVLSNSALKPIRSDKFFTGIRARIWKNIFMDASYIETSIDNIITKKIYYGAYPSNYTTYSNDKIGIVTKGLEVSMELANPLPSGINGGINFTRMFPENERYLSNYVSKMVFNANLSYRTGRGEYYKGPSGGIEKYLQGITAGIFFQYRSGLPYIATRDVMGVLYKGVEYTPDVKMFDIKVQKDFRVGKRSFACMYVIVENLFNFKNVFEVYPYTGEPDDDGYLNDPVWQQQINSQLNPDSYRLLYELSLYNPQHYGIPRIWRVGLNFRF